MWLRARPCNTPLGFSQIPVLFLTRCKGTTIPGMAVPLCPSLTDFFVFSHRNHRKHRNIFSMNLFDYAVFL